MMFPELSYSKVTRSGAIKNNDVTAHCGEREKYDERNILSKKFEARWLFQ